MKYVSLLLVLLLAAAMGCSTTTEGKRIDGTKTKSLLAEGTSSADVVKMFGEPQQKENLASGEVKYVYYYRYYNNMIFFPRPSDTVDAQRLEVFLKNNRVDRYRFMDREVDPITVDIPLVQPDRK
jgi:hypothetical protein